MNINKLTTKLLIIVIVVITGGSLTIGLLDLFRSQASIALASIGQDSEKAEGVNIPINDLYTDTTAMSLSASQTITGVVIAPADAYSYSVQIYTAPVDVDIVFISADITWSDDWHTPTLTETSQSFANIVEIPYQGGVGCDYIYNHEENNFSTLWLDAYNQFAQNSKSISIGPGKSVAIAGSDCGLGDNFHAHYHITWMATEGHQIFLPNVNK